MQDTKDKRKQERNTIVFLPSKVNYTCQNNDNKVLFISKLTRKHDYSIRQGTSVIQLAEL
jgi:hypothetical protein